MSLRSWSLRAVTLILGGVLVVLAAAPAIARAQSTLVVRRAAQAHPTIEAAMDEVLRGELGSSARRVEISLSDLALAAGCDGAIDGPDCIAAIARAASADLVAVEHVRQEGDTFHVRIVLYGADGQRLRALAAECLPGHCESALATAVHGGGEDPMEPAPARDETEPASSTEEAGATAVASAPRGGSARVVATDRGADGSAEVAADREPPPARSDFEVRASTVFYTGSAITGLGAIISGIVASDASSRAAGLGVVRTREDADTLVAAEQTRDGALITGVALAIAGAGLAVTGVILQTTEHDVQVTTLPTAGGAMISVGGTF